jgi:hypothetical protein
VVAVFGVVEVVPGRPRELVQLRAQQQQPSAAAAAEQDVLTPQQEQPAAQVWLVCLLYWNFYHEILYN